MPEPSLIGAYKVFSTAMRFSSCMRRLGGQCKRLVQTASGEGQIKMPPFDYQPKRYTGPTLEEVLQLRKQYLSPGMLLHINIKGFIFT